MFLNNFRYLQKDVFLPIVLLGEQKELMIRLRKMSKGMFLNNNI